jgi:magnesium-transporting ATPase (P-type)
MVIGFSVSAVALMPEEAVVFGFLLYFAIFLFKLAHVFTKKWCFSIIAPALFTGLYFFSWNTLFMNLFSTTTIVFSTALLSASFTREPRAKAKPIISRRNILSGLVLFVVLIVLADVTLVSGTNLMETAARKIEKLGLPLLVIVPTFPSTGSYVGLGLGDIFLSGLLGILAAKKMGRKAGVLCIFSISATVLLGETIMLNSNAGPLPATILVVAGWLAALGMRRLHYLGGLWL